MRENLSAARRRERGRDRDFTRDSAEARPRQLHVEPAIVLWFHPAAMAIHVYQYPKCSTCRKALAWLDDHGVEYTKSDLVSERILLAKLKEIHRRSGLPIGRFFNTSGESYRTGGFKNRLPAMSAEEALQALAADGKLVKRPIVDAGTKVLVGFDANAYARVFV
jgi:arsenate reductase